jgi:uncharacterized protein DUF5989
MSDRESRSEQPASEFERLAEQRRGEGFFSEFRYLLTRNRKYWMIPIIISLVMMGGFLILAGTTAAPLIYALF